MSYLLIGLAILPSVLLSGYVYKKDVIEKEPKSLLVLLFIFGVISTIPVIFTQQLIAEVFSMEPVTTSSDIFAAFFESFILAGMVEESCKWLFTYLHTWSHKDFNHIYDAIVYAVFVSLGFATIENVLYVFTFGIGVAVLRAILSVPAHAFFGVFMGIFIGRAKKAELEGNKKLSLKYKVLSLVIPILLHGTFNFCLLVDNSILTIFYLVFMICLYILSFRSISKIAKIPIMLQKDVSDNKIINDGKNKCYCHNCGTVILGNYCTNCGIRL